MVSFSADGKYLFFVSSRDFNPDFSNIESTISYSNMSSIYFVSLYKDVPSLFKPKSDEVELTKSEVKSQDTTKKKETKTPVKVSEPQIDIDGILSRIVKLPVAPSNYFNLNPAENKLYYQRRGKNDEKTTLYLYDFDKREEKNLGPVRWL